MDHNTLLSGTPENGADRQASTGSAPSGPGRVFVISLKRAEARRRAFLAAPPEGLDWEFFDACESLSPDLDYNERDAYVRNGRALHPRELACYSSHYSVWKKIADENIPQALIIEDDAAVEWPFVRLLFSYDLAAEGLHYLKLFNNRPVPFRVVQEPFLHKSLVRFSGYAHGMVAYVVTAEGARRLVERLQKVYRPVDDEIDRDWHHGLPNLLIYPQQAYERLGPSTIGNDRYEQSNVPAALRAERLLYRVIEKINRMFRSSPRRAVPIRGSIPQAPVPGPYGRTP